MTSPWIEGNCGFPGIEGVLTDIIFALKGNFAIIILANTVKREFKKYFFFKYV